MANTRDYTAERVEEILREKVDWREAFRKYIFGDYGDTVNIHDDGEMVVHGTGTYYRDPDAAGVIYGFSCAGFGNLDTTYFTEGFVEWDEEKESYVELHDGRVVGSMEDVAEEVVRDGEYSDWIEEHIENAYRQHEEYLREVKLGRP